MVNKTNTKGTKVVEPVITKESEALMNFFKAQLDAFLSAKPTSNKEFSARDKALFTTAGSDVITNEFPDLKLFVLNRMLRTDRDNRLVIKKASCAIMVWDMAVIRPAYYISCYINTKGIASIMVVPQDETGPSRKNINWWSNGFDDQQ